MITLATLPQATEQQVFDQVVEHLMRQGQKCEKEYEPSGRKVCCYRNPEGMKCAAGALIGDDEYLPKMDENERGSDWESLIEAEIVPPDHRGLIWRLQDIHDSFEPEDWEEHLIILAKNRNLQYNFPTHA